MGSKVEDTNQHLLGSLRKNIPFWRKNKTTGSNLVKAFAPKTLKLLQLDHKTFSVFLLSLPCQPTVTVILEALGCTKKQQIKSNLTEVVPSCM